MIELVKDITDVEFTEVTKEPEVPQEFTETTDEMKDEERLLILMKPIREQILKCNTRKDILMLSSAMLHHAKDLFILELGVDAAKILFNNLKFEEPVNEEEND
jgi:hypothetical protein